ncbi:cilia- and flagella-associated protein 298-A-like [Paramacrobiotus metropolitanus]|uniref:cilia- and flagella-associated protein 298-A-like n=1 Tax=Paramacrobiotus metropolitanus TaxID=2943436 RepID=UPI002445714E|nr:cilia- and flagella-associated protein 298-A-like [Paramacrobiotus metropolitanus]
MVLLHVKKGDDDLFLFECSVSIPITSLTIEIAKIHNGRQKIFRMCSEMDYLADHGVSLPTNMVGLLPDQIQELKLTDPGATMHTPSGGSISNPDPHLKRNGHAPDEEMAKLLRTTCEAAKQSIHKNLIQQGTVLSYDHISEQFLKLRDALMAVYPMGLPLYDPLHVESTSMEAADLDCGYGSFRDVIDPQNAVLWWAGKELKGQDEKLLRNFIGSNEKTKIVIKLTQKGSGAPGREACYTDEQRKAMMAQAFRRQQEVEKLMEDDDDHYLNSQWADSRALKRSFQGINNIKFRPV